MNKRGLRDLPISRPMRRPGCPIGRALSSAFFAALCCCLPSSCASAGDADEEPNWPRLRVGLSGAGVALEITGQEGRGIGLALGLYAVSPEWGRLPKTADASR